MNTKDNVSEVGMQVCNDTSRCIVDSGSYNNSHQLCPEALGLIQQVETKADVDLVNLEMVQITDNPTIDVLIKEKFVCPICHGLLVRARILVCGHHFCRECLYCWFKVSHMCPMCRRPGRLNVAAWGIDTFLDELVQACENEELKMQREHRKAEHTSVALDEMESHTTLVTTVTSNFAQTISAYSQGITTDTWTQAGMEP
ncbi:uncharacterized RING finger protein C548.05c [Clonorchis sinensis]|uniref:Uncharacterized RING finger protein C548.05c n=1 Tax=Clonorchis sinensis TaxID=79923 RepID=H2KNN6_CLOSI|nr:uncharacterized RING finger protein C548.05c [Clonorchis sinensis]